MSSTDWAERVVIGPRTRWFWDPLCAQHVGRYLWARTRVPNGLILDVACGTGYGSAILAGPGRQVRGIDSSTTAIEHARLNYASNAVSFGLGEATELPLATSSVDCVVSFETIEHLAEPQKFTAEIARVLRPGGRLLVSTPDRFYYSPGRSDGRSDNPFHPSEMTRDELLALVQRDFVVLDVLGQSRAPETEAVSTHGGARDGRSALRERAKNAVKLVTSPLLANDAAALRLFPYLRRSHLPVSARSGRFTYIIVCAEKPT